MTKRRTHRFVGTLLVLLLAAVLAGCGGGDDGQADGEAEAEEFEDVSDDADGSDEPDDEEPEDEEPEDEDAEDEDPDESDEDDEGAMSGEREDAFDDFADDVKDDIGPLEEESTYVGYTTAIDESGYLATEIPNVWSDVNLAFGLFGPSIVASTDIDTFYQYGASGLNLQVTSLETNQSADEVLDAISATEQQNCTPTPREAYRDPVIQGTFEVFVDCAGTTTDVIWLAFEPHDGSFHGILGIAVTSDADFDAFEHALAGLSLGE